MTKYQQARKHIKELLAPRLNKLGSIRTGDTWRPHRELYGYDVFSGHLRAIMEEVVAEGRADKLTNGTWFIHKNKK